MGFGVQGLGLRGLGFRGLGSRVQGLGFRVYGALVEPHRTLTEALKPPQRAQYPLIKEYTLNHNIKAPII